MGVIIPFVKRVITPIKRYVTVNSCVSNITGLLLMKTKEWLIWKT